jgi:CubicO group peptidase (beta-lactamase class C family)
MAITEMENRRSVGRGAPVQVEGYCAPGFERVRRAFEENFRLRREVGASFAVFCGGERIIDLWGGLRDAESEAPWLERTMALVCSTTKGISAALIGMAHSRGLIDFDARVARYWPEFAVNGKQDVTVRQLFAHQAGLICVDGGLDVAGMADLDGLAVRLAWQKPYWRPGDFQGYHAFTIGLYMNELLRRIDPRGRSLGVVLQEDVIGRLGGELHIGLPATVDPEKDLAQIVEPPFLRATADILASATLRRIMGQLANPWSDFSRLTLNVQIRSFKAMMRPDFLRIECPAGNGAGNARTIAKVYGALASGAAGGLISDATLAAFAAPPVPPKVRSRDRILRSRTPFSLGFFKPCEEFRFGSDGRSFGCLGGGGSYGFADPTRRLGVAYVPNYFDNHPWNDPRERALHAALYASL